MQQNDDTYSLEFPHSDARMLKGKLAYARSRTSRYYSVMPTRLDFEDEKSIRRTQMADTRESERATRSGSLRDDNDDRQWWTE